MISGSIGPFVRHLNCNWAMRVRCRRLRPTPPLVVADNQGLKNNRTWSPNSYKNNNWNKNWNKNGNWNNNAYWNKKYPNKHWNKNRVYVRTWKPSTASSSAASFWARS